MKHQLFSYFVLDLNQRIPFVHFNMAQEFAKVRAAALQTPVIIMDAQGRQLARECPRGVCNAQAQ